MTLSSLLNSGRKQTLQKKEERKRMKRLSIKRLWFEVTFIFVLFLLGFSVFSRGGFILVKLRHYKSRLGLDTKIHG